MFKNKTILAIIPARGGSKEVPRKNIRELGGKPLIAWTIEAAQQSKYLDRLILSSEDTEVIKIAKDYGCEVPFVRPIELARDNTPGIEPVIHAINALSEKYDYVMLLQPTSPLRSVIDIDECIEYAVKQNVLSCVSVAEVDKNPYWMYILDADCRLHQLIKNKKKFNQRQDLPKVYVLNGALYIICTDWFLCNRTFISDETYAFIMPKSRSIDIDDTLDFKFVDFLLHERVIN